MGDLTQIPTFTIPTSPAAANIGLGPELVNPRQTYDYTREVDNEVVNYLRHLAAYHQQVVGVKVSGETLPPHDSLRALASSRRYVFRDYFDAAAVNPHYWSAGAGALPAVIGGLRAGCKFELNGNITCDRNLYAWSKGQQPKIECDIMLDAVPAADDKVRFQFVDGSGNEGWAIYLQKTTQNVKGVTRTGGADTKTTCGVYVVGTELHLSFWIDATGHLQVSLDGGHAVDCGAVTSSAAMSFYMKTDDSTAGKYLYVYNFLHTADWT